MYSYVAWYIAHRGQSDHEPIGSMLSWRRDTIVLIWLSTIHKVALDIDEKALQRCFYEPTAKASEN